MRIIVVGCGRIGSDLAYRLFKKGHTVTVIEEDEKRFDNLPGDFEGRTVQGEFLSQDVLHRAGIEQADGLAAVTPTDSLNAVVAHIAQAVYHVPHVVVRNYHPHWRKLHEAFGHQVVSSTSWGVRRMEELLYHEEMRTIFSAGNGEVEVEEIIVTEAWHGKTLGEVLPDEGVLPVALTRAGRATLPTPDAVLEHGDLLYVSGTGEGVEQIRRALAQTKGA